MTLDVAECDCCGFPGVSLEEYGCGPGSIDPTRKKRLCALCASTPAAAGLEYRHRQGESHEVMKTICYVGNAILAELRRSPSD